MLILQRKKEQSLIIGDNIRISVLDVGNDWVKLAIDAPRELPVFRSELIEAAKANREAIAAPENIALDKMRVLWKRQESLQESGDVKQKKSTIENKTGED